MDKCGNIADKHKKPPSHYAARALERPLSLPLRHSAGIAAWPTIRSVSVSASSWVYKSTVSSGSATWAWLKWGVGMVARADNNTLLAVAAGVCYGGAFAALWRFAGVKNALGGAGVLAVVGEGQARVTGLSAARGRLFVLLAGSSSAAAVYFCSASGLLARHTACPLKSLPQSPNFHATP